MQQDGVDVLLRAPSRASQEVVQRAAIRQSIICLTLKRTVDLLGCIVDNRFMQHCENRCNSVDTRLRVDTVTDDSSMVRLGIGEPP